ncbi:uncharacterized protein LOC117335234 [Pecten maximus]|uniref:uncharacterized protein LOC117335234 n=1 Tax=Pecten maximus TaxID=6579 RepID=UPI001457F07B|nr:uncharacterized protein LOC117335234 [Pecten maximus]
MGTNFDELWKSTEAKRNDVLKTTFVDGVGAGTLDPVKFGGFVIQDCVYLYEQYKCIKAAAQRATDKDLKKFLSDVAGKYDGYYRDAFKAWHIEQASGIELGTACQAYVKYMQDAQKLDTIYFLVSMTPCLSLWAWLGEQLQKKNKGVYAGWVKNNFAGGSTLKRLEKEINEAKLDIGIAKNLFKDGMDHEYKFFSSA